MAGARHVAMAAIVIHFMAGFGNAESDPDPCQPLARVIRTQGVALIADARTCLSSFPFNSTLAAQIIDTLRSTIPFYTYLEISRESPTIELPLEVDLEAGLDAISNSSYASDFAFHRELYDLFDGLRDGHTAYLPRCYAAVVSEIAFPLVLYHNGRSPIIEVAAIEFDADDPLNYVVEATRNTGLDPSLYRGAQVLYINKVPAYSYLLNYANQTMGQYKDINARLNVLFARPAGKEGYYIPGEFVNRKFVDKDDSIVFTVRRIGTRTLEDITIPWFASFGPNQIFSDAAEYYSLYCAAPAADAVPPADSATTRSKKRISSSIHPLRKGKGKARQNSNRIQAVQSPQATLLVDGFVQTWLLADAKTAVMVIPDFLGEYIGAGQYDEGGWYNGVLRGAVAMQRVSARRLIFDLSDNGGGFAEFPDSLLQFIFPKTLNSSYPMQFRAHPLIERLISEASNPKYGSDTMFSYTNFQDVDSVPFKSNSQFFYPTEEEWWGGERSEFSSLFKSQHDSPSLLLPDFLRNMFEKERIMILTNGACFSACAVFTSRMEEYYGIRTVTVGGIASKKMTYGAGVVGAAYTLDALLYNDINFLGFSSDADAPQPFPVQAVFGFTLLQSFCNQFPSIPADFAYNPADVHILFDKTTVLSKAAIWRKASKYF